MTSAATAVPFLDLGAATAELREGIDRAVARVLASGRYVGGPEVEGFERDWARWCGAAHAVGCGNGLDALVLALRAVGVGPGDGVVVPAHTFVATWHAVAALGAVVQPAPVDPDTLTLCPRAAASVVDSRTMALLPVHMHGRPADMAGLRALADRHGLALVEDAAQAHGARIDGRRIGAHGDAVAWSFYPAKTLGALGDGGAVTTDDPRLAERARRLGNYGWAARHDARERGLNSRLDPLQAAVLGVKLPRLADWVERRARVAARYAAGLRGLPGLTLPRPDPGHGWHHYAVRHPRRDALADALAAAGVETQVHYPVPCHRQGAHAAVTMDPAGRAQADVLSATLLSLPMGPHLADAQVDAAIAAIRTALR